MSTVQDSNAAAINQKQNHVDAFEYFSRGKEEQLRQLEPFSNKSTAYLTELIQKTWNSLSESDKALYSEEANYVIPDSKKSKKADKNGQDSDEENNTDEDESEENDTYPGVHIDCRDAIDIYIKEMNNIILQDTYFATNHSGLIKMLWLKGWIMLREEQRDEYILRSKKVMVLCRKESTLHNIAKSTSKELRKVLPSDDELAQRALRKDLCPHMFGLPCSFWYDLAPSQREEYLVKTDRDLVTQKSCELYISETKEKLPKGLQEGLQCLECDYNNLNDADKKCYLEKGEKAAKLEIDNDRKRIAKTVPITDPLAVPLFKMYYNGWERERNNDNYAFDVYCLKMWPSLEKEPGMANKRGYESTLILLKRWNALDEEEKECYYDVVPRIKETQRKIKHSDLSNLSYFPYEEGLLNDEEKVAFEEKVLQLRKQLMEEIPDFYEYFSWQRKEEYSNTKEKYLDCRVYDLKMKEYPGKPFIIRQIFIRDWFSYDDPINGIKELCAFEQFKEDFCNHDNGLNEVGKWQKWFELSDAQQDEYFAKFQLKKLRYFAFRRFIRHRGIDDTPYCPDCLFDNLDEDEKQKYFKLARKTIKRQHKQGFKKRSQELADELKEYSSVMNCNSMHLWPKRVKTIYRAKMLVHPHRSLEVNTFLAYFQKFMPTFIKLKENQNIPYLRVCEKLEQQFWDLPAEERQSYFDSVLRHIELFKMMEPLKHLSSYLDSQDPSNDSSDSDNPDAYALQNAFWSMSKSEQAAWKKKLLQARTQLLHDNPDVGNYFYVELDRDEHFDYDEEAEDDQSKSQDKKAPTPFICFVHTTRPIMLENHEFAAKEESEQRRFLKTAWKQLSKEQKAVFHQKEQRVLSRIEMKLFYRQFSDLMAENDLKLTNDVDSESETESETESESSVSDIE